MRRHQGTFQETNELAFAQALFVRTTNASPSNVRRHLEITQREAFDEALRWLDGQPKLVRDLRDNPSSLTDGIFTIEKKKGLLSRLLSREPETSLPEVTLPRPAKERTEAERRRIEEAKALVEEALQDS